MIVTIDFACFRLNDSFEPEVLLRKRTNPNEPAYGDFGLIGGWVWEKPLSDGGEYDVDAQSAIKRIIRQKVGVEPSYIKNVGYEGSETRDSRGWSITLIHLCLLSKDDAERLEVNEDFSWVSVTDVLSGELALPFDHSNLVNRAWVELVNMSGYSTIGLRLLPKTFFISDVVNLFGVFGINTSKQTVHNRVVKSGVIVESAGDIEQLGVGKRATPYELSSSEVQFFKNSLS